MVKFRSISKRAEVSGILRLRKKNQGFYSELPTNDIKTRIYSTLLSYFLYYFFILLATEKDFSQKYEVRLVNTCIEHGIIIDSYDNVERCKSIERKRRLLFLQSATSRCISQEAKNNLAAGDTL